MDTPRIRRVSVSNTDTTPTHNYTELCDFLKLLVVSVCQCPCQYPCFIVCRCVLFVSFSNFLIVTSNNLMFDKFLTLSKVILVGLITSTMYLHLKTYPKNELSGNLYMSALFYGLVHMLFNGTTELSLLIFRLPVFYKQRGNLFYPAWAWTLSTWILQFPYSIVESVAWTGVVYYIIGFAPSLGRYFTLHSYTVL